MVQLNARTLGALGEGVTKPAYDRAAVTPGIVHLGIGAFHRAHMAVYVDDLLAETPDWGIVGASLRRPDTRNALAPQDGLYSIAVRDGSGTLVRIIGSILEVIDANTERERLLSLMAQPEIRIVSLTITEKGYCHDPATGVLDEANPDIVHDLQEPTAPVSAPGIIVEALARRRAAGIAPFTVLSCDNLPSNGVTTGRIVTRFAALRDAALGQWVEASVAFPSTMVDRIVPATTDADRAMITEVTGLEDAWPIMTEPFTQWVIHDHFTLGRPAFDRVGAQLVADVEPYELMKLRMLNGAHSSIAYLGYLAGHAYVAEVMGSADFRAFIAGLMTEEAMPTLDMPGVDLGAYRDELLARFSNPALNHRTWQIAMDGSQKLPQRLLGTIRDRKAAGLSYRRLALGVAAWIRYAAGTDEKGEPIDVRDPFVERFEAIAADADGDAERLVAGFLQIGEVFGPDLREDAAFRQIVTEHLKALIADGAAQTVARNA
ncbi:mannitol dehydrogenase family protein [Arsenicitalea aurantiaca]|uniref:Mannitol dehydrogenase family protein n=1 Tax=Arsenicitalea aurantiaca TaxID=1783274 RepID=A0A433XB83_9HYPH|nr:mannitol dehydrogenase family protein [Arsenicitalea aurantiaca]RUT31339.1 mannitol dehydrogenase family protein [Arsenicitalea aurantiaca]